jgi:hypothetical protein
MTEKYSRGSSLKMRDIADNNYKKIVEKSYSINSVNVINKNFISAPSNTTCHENNLNYQNDKLESHINNA